MVCGVVDSGEEGPEVVIANGEQESRIFNPGKMTWRTGPATPFRYQLQVSK